MVGSPNPQFPLSMAEFTDNAGDDHLDLMTQTNCVGNRYGDFPTNVNSLRRQSCRWERDKLVVGSKWMKAYLDKTSRVQ